MSDAPEGWHSVRIDEAELSVRSARCLRERFGRDGTLGQVVDWLDRDGPRMDPIPQLGKISVAEIRGLIGRYEREDAKLYTLAPAVEACDERIAGLDPEAILAWAARHPHLMRALLANEAVVVPVDPWWMAGAVLRTGGLVGGGSVS